MSSIGINNNWNYQKELIIKILIIIIKKDWQCKAGRGRLTPYQSDDPILHNEKKFQGVQKEQQLAQNTAMQHSWHNIYQFTATSIHQRHDDLLKMPILLKVSLRTL